MPDSEKSRASEQAPGADSSEEAADSPMWALYVLEAEKYDKSLVESWKSDMEGILIFPTAFIIESYKTLTPDSGVATVQLLSQNSQQLAAAANGSTFSSPTRAGFAPSGSSLLCNVLWFISLGLSLSCALIATLLEQWARNFLHRADMRSSPIVRARIYSFLYYGLKRFKVHTIVDIIPLLLHASLVFFFAGLVAFLIPINAVVAAVAAALLAFIVVVYSLLTFIPLWHLDCPYHTPLSTAVWPIARHLMILWRLRYNAVADTNNSLSTKTMVQAMSDEAMLVSPARSARDYRALVWTVKSLSDDIELDAFIETIPDLLWGSAGGRRSYEDHIQKLLRHPDLRLLRRIAGPLRSCDNGLISLEAAKRRQTTCLKTLWAIGHLQTMTHATLDFTELIDHLTSVLDPEALLYSTSTVLLLRWSAFASIKGQLAGTLASLVQCTEDGRTPNLGRISSYLKSVEQRLAPMDSRFWKHFSAYGESPQFVPELIQAITEFCLVTPYQMLLSYLATSVRLAPQPYQWEQNLAATSSLDASVPFSTFQRRWQETLEDVVRLHTLKTSSSWKASMEILCSLWQPSKPMRIPSGIIYYLNARTPLLQRGSLHPIADSSRFHLWSSFPITLQYDTQGLYAGTNIATDTLTALWHLALEPVPWTGDNLPVSLHEAVLDAIEHISDSPNITISVVGLIKARLFHTFVYSDNPAATGEVAPLMLRLFPTETAVPLHPKLFDTALVAPRISSVLNFVPQNILLKGTAEANLALVADFLNAFCYPESPPYQPLPTLQYMCGAAGTNYMSGPFVDAPLGKVHTTHQIRFAHGLQRVLDSGHPQTAELLAVIVTSGIFEKYSKAAQPPTPYQAAPHPGYPWLEDTTARTQIKDLFTHSNTAKMFSESGQAWIAEIVPARITAILRGLEALHAGA